MSFFAHVKGIKNNLARLKINKMTRRMSMRPMIRKATMFDVDVIVRGMATEREKNERYD